MNPILQKLISQEIDRQQNTLGLIASENIASKAVREAVGSVLMHKYSEGQAKARYYEGNEFIDDIEILAKEMILKVMAENNHSKELSENWHANVQVISGSTANLAVYNAILEPGDTILTMFLPDGGHLSHGWNYGTIAEDEKPEWLKSLPEKTQKLVHLGSKKVTAVSKIYNVVQYKTDPDTNLLNYEAIEEIANVVKPKLIITGGTAYPRNIDYAKMSKISKSINAYYMSDVAHEAGLIAAGELPSPFEYADFVTFTTHKTFRGPRGAVAMCKKEFANALDKSVMPGFLGGPFNHTIAGVLQAAYEIDTKEFKEYANQVVKNAQKMANELIKKDYEIISGGIDKHLVLIKLTNKNISGKYLSKALAYAGIITNMNTVPYETGSPTNPSGLRLGTALITTRGMKESEIEQIVEMIDKVYLAVKDYTNLEFVEFEEKLSSIQEIENIKKEVVVLTNRFAIE